MLTYDFDFQRYVERRKGAREAERREGKGYAYAGDLRIRKLLERARPVTLALEATVKLWQATARAELLGTAVKATTEQFPRAVRAMQRAAERLHVTPSAVHVSPHLQVSLGVFGTDDEAHVLLHAQLLETLGEAELLFALGTALGRIQNEQVLLLTARHYLAGGGPRLLRWFVGPARASLDAWARRGEVTADRAGLLAARDLDAALRAIAQLGAPLDAGTATAAAGAPLDGEKPGAAADSHDDGDAPLTVAGRQRALEVFAKSAYYRGTIGAPGSESGGLSAADTDAETARALKGAKGEA